MLFVLSLPAVPVIEYFAYTRRLGEALGDVRWMSSGAFP
jgi:hypothetical protein